MRKLSQALGVEPMVIEEFQRVLVEKIAA
jgi:hypothetical protein